MRRIGREGLVGLTGFERLGQARSGEYHGPQIDRAGPELRRLVPQPVIMADKVESYDLDALG